MKLYFPGWGIVNRATADRKTNVSVRLIRKRASRARVSALKPMRHVSRLVAAGELSRAFHFNRMEGDSNARACCEARFPNAPSSKNETRARIDISPLVYFCTACGGLNVKEVSCYEQRERLLARKEREKRTGTNHVSRKMCRAR